MYISIAVGVGGLKTVYVFTKFTLDTLLFAIPVVRAEERFGQKMARSIIPT